MVSFTILTLSITFSILVKKSTFYFVHLLLLLAARLAPDVFLFSKLYRFNPLLLLTYHSNSSRGNLLSAASLRRVHQLEQTPICDLDWEQTPICVLNWLTNERDVCVLNLHSHFGLVFLILQ